MHELNDDAVNNLRYAIVELAARDYFDALQYLHRHKMPSDARDKAEWRKNECEAFFRSGWFSQLCDLDGEAVMEIIRQKSYHGSLNFGKVGKRYAKSDD